MTNGIRERIAKSEIRDEEINSHLANIEARIRQLENKWTATLIAMVILSFIAGFNGAMEILKIMM